MTSYTGFDVLLVEVISFMWYMQWITKLTHPQGDCNCLHRRKSTTFIAVRC